MAEKPPAKLPAKDKPAAETREPNSGPVDDRARAELGWLYEESWHALLFAKAQQWKTLGATLIVYLTLVVIAKYVAPEPAFVGDLIAAIILVCTASIFVVIIYQLWQYDELRKLEAVAKHLSPAFREIRRLKSRTESNIYRYILLMFIIVMLVLGAVIAYLTVMRAVK